MLQLSPLGIPLLLPQLAQPMIVVSIVPLPQLVVSQLLLSSLQPWFLDNVVVALCNASSNASLHHPLAFQGVFLLVNMWL